MSFSHRAYSLEPVGAPYRFGLWHKHRAHPRGYLDELRVRIRTMFHSGADKRFLIFGRARSGTTLLVRLLRQVPDLKCDGEVLHYGVVDPRGHLNRLARSCDAPTYGCKLLSYQLIEVQRIMNPRAFFEGLVEDGFRLIHIRRDTFAQAMSLSIAQESAVYHLRADAGAGTRSRVRLDPHGFVKQLEWNLALLDFERRLMTEFDHLEIDYDRDLTSAEGHQSTADRLCAFVGVSSAPVTARTNKVIDRSYADLIENYDEVARAVEEYGPAEIQPPR